MGAFPPLSCDRPSDLHGELGDEQHATDASGDADEEDDEGAEAGEAHTRRCGRGCRLGRGGGLDRRRVSGFAAVAARKDGGRSAGGRTGSAAGASAGAVCASSRSRSISRRAT